MAYAGSRLEAIENRVKYLFNDDSGRFYAQSQFVASANACLKDLAMRGLFTKETGINSVAGTYKYDLLVLSDFVDVDSVRWYTGFRPIKPCQSMEQFDRIRLAGLYAPLLYGSGPSRFIVDSDSLYLWPAPDETTTNGIFVRYRYEPAEFSIASSYTPPSPRSWDLSLYVEFILSDLYTRRTGDATAQQSATDHAAKYELQCRKLERQRKSPGQAVYPYR